MKIRPVILCGGAGTRLWPDKKNHQAKQFIDFGGWSLIQKTLERVNKPIFDFPPSMIKLIFFPNSSITSKTLMGLRLVDIFALGIARGKFNFLSKFLITL